MKDKTLNCVGMVGNESQCDKENITHIDHKGFIYCESCARIRSVGQRVRKLTGKELNFIFNGKQLERY